MTAADTTAAPEYLSLAQAQARFGVHRRTLAKLIHAGRLPAYRPGCRRMLVAAAEVEAYIRSRPVAAGGAA
jgi:excisionase family DNA binding protein